MDNFIEQARRAEKNLRFLERYGSPETKMTREDRVIPCETCGDPTVFTGTRRCNNCWEVERRIELYLESPKGREFIVKELQCRVPAADPSSKP